MLETGKAKSITKLAHQENLKTSYMASVIRLIDLAPDITAAILQGNQPSTLQLQDLLRGGLLPLDWNGADSKMRMKVPITNISVANQALMFNRLWGIYSLDVSKARLSGGV